MAPTSRPSSGSRSGSGSWTLPVALDVAPEQAARSLLGCELVHVKAGRRTSGRIVECEAYAGIGADACSHAFRRRTDRNKAMFGPPGRIYVYFTYGMHYCVNVVAHLPGEAGAVLIRALEPRDGVDLMRRRRGLPPDAPLRNLCAGPARLVVAMGLGRADDGRRLDTGRLHLVAGEPPASIAEGVRVGVGDGPDSDRLWRVGEAGSAWLSRPI